jgi:hypothetical protein
LSVTTIDSVRRRISLVRLVRLRSVEDVGDEGQASQEPGRPARSLQRLQDLAAAGNPLSEEVGKVPFGRPRARELQAGGNSTGDQLLKNVTVRCVKARSLVDLIVSEDGARCFYYSGAFDLRQYVGVGVHRETDLAVPERLHDRAG